MEPSWLDTANDIDQSTIEVDQKSYPFIQWVNGDRKLRAAGGVPYTGGWAMQCTHMDVETLPGWTRGELEHGAGTTECWFKRDLTVALIRSRKAWTVTARDGTTQLFAWDQYDAARTLGQPRGKLQVLAFVQGLDPVLHGPFMLTLKGSYARAITDTLIPLLNKQVIGVANAANAKRGVKARFPYRAFWVTIGPDREVSGEPRFTTVGKAPNTQQVVLPVALGLADKLTMQDVARLFVGAELLRMATAVFEEAETWATALTKAPEPAVEATTEATTGMGEEPIPF